MQHLKLSIVPRLNCFFLSRLNRIDKYYIYIYSNEMLHVK